MTTAWRDRANPRATRSLASGEKKEGEGSEKKKGAIQFVKFTTRFVRTKRQPLLPRLVKSLCFFTVRSVTNAALTLPSHRQPPLQAAQELAPNFHENARAEGGYPDPHRVHSCRSMRTTPLVAAPNSFSMCLVQPPPTENQSGSPRRRNGPLLMHKLQRRAGRKKVIMIRGDGDEDDRDLIANRRVRS